MRQDLTDITILLDRSGSMSSCKAAAEEGFGSFVAKQREAVDPAKGGAGAMQLTLLQFDDQYECVYANKNVNDVPPLVLNPRGWTCLNDCTAKAIIETGERLSAIPEDQRPGTVMFIIITDGGENKSREHPGEEGRLYVKGLLERQQKVYNWQVSYLGANQDAFATAQGYGIPAAATANFATAQAKSAFRGVAGLVARSHQGGVSGQAVPVAYTDEERTSMNP